MATFEQLTSCIREGSGMICGCRAASSSRVRDDFITATVSDDDRLAEARRSEAGGKSVDDPPRHWLRRCVAPVVSLTLKHLLRPFPRLAGRTGTRRHRRERSS